MTNRRDNVERLQQALDDFAASGGGTLFDHQEEESKAAVRKRALGLLDHRARSRSELTGRLTDLDFDPGVIAAVLDDLAAVGLLDDQAFADEWVRQRHLRRGKSAQALDRELQAKDVAESVRARALAQVSDEDEEAAARAAAAKKARSIMTVPGDRHERDKALRRIVGVLARRGYGGEMSLRVAREELAARLTELGGE